MSIASIITGSELKIRNDDFIKQLEIKQKSLSLLMEEREKNQLETENLEKIKEVLNKELAFENGINSALVASMLDKIVVKKKRRSQPYPP